MIPTSDLIALQETINEFAREGEYTGTWHQISRETARCLITDEPKPIRELSETSEPVYLCGQRLRLDCNDDPVYRAVKFTVRGEYTTLMTVFDFERVFDLSTTDEPGALQISPDGKLL